MPYLNLDDNFAQHDKIDTLSNGAFRLHVAGLCHAAKNLTDGFIDKRRVPRLMPDYRTGFLTELTEASIWFPAPGGYTIHDYLDWNKSKEWWDMKREKDAKRKAEWRASHIETDEGEPA